LLAGGLYSQEICDNALDDDADGLIDLNDPDCTCTVPGEIPSFLPNSSFESYEPGGDCFSSQESGAPDNVNQANCLSGWRQVSEGTTDAWNAFTFNGRGPYFPAAIPQPMPNGSGLAGFWVGVSEAEGEYREYLGACIEDNPLEQGVYYSLEFSLGFIDYQIFGDSIVYSPPVELTLYGVEQCGDLPFSGTGCPEAEGAPGYIPLATVSVSGSPGSWQDGAFFFYVPTTIRAIAVGGSCSPAPDGGNDFSFWRNYYFIDNLLLNEKEVLEGESVGSIQVQGTAVCQGDARLTAPFYEDVAYQWYRNGVAILGADQGSYLPPETEPLPAEFTVRVDWGDRCGIAPPILLDNPQINFSLADSFSLCADTIFISSSFGGRYTYAWNTGATTPSIPVGEPGDYYVTVTNACGSLVDTVSVVDDVPYRFEVTPEEPVACAGDPVTLQVTSDWFLFYNWRDGEDRPRGGAPQITFNVNEPTYVTLLTFDQCSNRRDTTIFIEVGESVPYTAAITAIDCDNPTGSIALTPPDGVAAEYRWADAGNTPLGNSAEITALSPGAYSVTITAPEWCPADTVFTVTSLVTLRGALAQSEVSCFGLSDGTARIEITGGDPPFTVEWIDANGTPVGNTNTVTGLSAGMYRVIATDAAGCRWEGSLTIEEPEPLSASATVSYANCDVPDSGIITVVPSGGTAPYRFQSGTAAPQNNPRISNLPRGIYAVNVADANGCRFDLPDVEVTPPPVFRLNAGGDQQIGLGTILQHRVLVSPPSLPLASITWTPADGLSCTDCLEPEISPVRSTRYQLTVVAENGCVATDELLVEVRSTARVFVPSAFSPNGDGINDRLRYFSDSSIENVSAFRVFDRWGALVYQGEGKDVPGWDGRIGSQAAPVGSYLYQLRAVLLDGREIQRSGSVMLLR
jgi:gliding motility-associated-like protein